MQVPGAALPGPPPNSWPPQLLLPPFVPENPQGTYLGFSWHQSGQQRTLKGLRLQPVPFLNPQSFGTLPSPRQVRAVSMAARTAPGAARWPGLWPPRTPARSEAGAAQAMEG